MRVWQPEIQVVFVKIEPALSGALYLGAYKLPNGKTFSGFGWTYHWAVLSNGVARDEVYPYEVAYEDYKKLFRNREDLSFDEHPEVL